MSVSERRARNRCPVCQGPTKDGDGADRCRNSLCSHNHQNVKCPRCQHPGPEATKFDSEGFHYFCGECHNKWKVQAASA